MMMDILAFLVVLVLAVWLGNQVLRVDAALAKVRARIQSIKNSETRLVQKLEKLAEEEKRVASELDTLAEEITTFRAERSAAEKRIAEIEASRRQRLHMLSQRRVSGDRDWIVKMVNDEAAGAPPPVSTEWQGGRDYLVWAKSEDEAMKLAMRRFASRGPGIRAVSAEPANLFSVPP